MRGSDRVSLQIFDDKIREFLPPGSTRQHLHQLLSLLEHNRPARRDLAGQLRSSRASLHLRRRGTVDRSQRFLR